MPVIKSPNAPVSIIPFSMRDIEQHARSLISKARQQADQFLADAQKEAVVVRQNARLEGFAAGRDEGSAKGMEEGKKAGHQQALSENKAQLSNLIKALTTATKEIDQQRRKLESEALTEVVSLATAIARRITKRQGMLDPKVLESNIVEAMKLVVRANDLRIAIHPSQKQTLINDLPRMQLDWPALEHVELIEDAGLAIGGCRIHTRNGLVDADLNSQLDRVIEEMLPNPL